jgi:hypothetical protein
LKDWFLKQKLNFDLDLLKSEVMPKIEHAEWSDARYNQAPGTKWCLLSLTGPLVTQIEESIAFPVYPDFYIWNYGEVKELLIHKDGNDPGDSRSIVGCIPLIGDFECQVYSEHDHTQPMDACRYGPGDVLILNNTKYHHGGRVLSETRLSLHFYLDFFNTEGLSLPDILRNHGLR